MRTDTLTFPAAFPDVAPRPDSRRFRDLLSDLKARWASAAQPTAARMEREVRKSARRGRQVVLGTTDLPYEPLVLDGAPLRALRPFDGLEITVTTGSPEIAEHLDLLVDLDQRHAVTVDVLIACLDPESPDLRERLEAITALGAEGITTRLIATEPTDLADSRIGYKTAEHWLRRLFESTRDLPVYDVVSMPVDEGDSEPDAWYDLLQRLRLEHGFPRQLPGRG